MDAANAGRKLHGELKSRAKFEIGRGPRQSGERVDAIRDFISQRAFCDRANGMALCGKGAEICGRIITVKSLRPEAHAGCDAPCDFAAGFQTNAVLAAVAELPVHNTHQAQFDILRRPPAIEPRRANPSRAVIAVGNAPAKLNGARPAKIARRKLIQGLEFEMSIAKFAAAVVCDHDRADTDVFGNGAAVVDAQGDAVAGVIESDPARQTERRARPHRWACNRTCSLRQGGAVQRGGREKERKEPDVRRTTYRLFLQRPGWHAAAGYVGRAQLFKVVLQSGETRFNLAKLCKRDAKLRFRERERINAGACRR